MAEKRRPAATSRLWEKYLRREGMPTIWCPGCGIGTAVGAMLRAIDREGEGTPRPRWNVMLAGLGGQGLALAGVILADAAGIQEGRHVAQTETHSTNVRGGPSRSEVVISAEEIDYPAVDRLDVLLALTGRDVKLYGSRLQPGGLLVVDSERAGELPPVTGRVAVLPLLDIALRQLGNEVVAGIVGLAAAVTLTSMVSWEALERAVLARVPTPAQELNRRALELGRQVAGEKERWTSN